MKFLTLIGIIALMWLVGLFAFADRVRKLTPADEPARADAIVALTGPSAERVTPPSACWNRTRASES